jgi:hypothetical protein
MKLYPHDRYGLDRIPASDELPLDYGAAFARVARLTLDREQALSRERAEAPRLAARLLAQPAPRRQLLLENSRRFATWGLFQWLVTESLEGSPAEEKETVARVALAVSLRLDVPYYGARRIEDLRARAWVSIGQARRLAGDGLGARRAGDAAYFHLLQGTGEPLERALFLELKAALLIDAGEETAALPLLERAATIYTQAGESRRASVCRLPAASPAVRAAGGLRGPGLTAGVRPIPPDGS